MQMNKKPSIGTTLTYGEAIKAYDRFERTMLEKAYGAELLPTVGLYDLLWQLESLAQKFGIEGKGGLLEAQEGDPVVLEREDRSGKWGERREVLPAGLATLMWTVPGGAQETGGSTGMPRSSARPACSSSTSSGFSRSTRTGRGCSSRSSPTHTRGSRWYSPRTWSSAGVGGVRGRPDGRRPDRPHRPPREARPVPWRVLPRPSCPHAGGLAAQKACALPMLRLLNF